MLLYAAAAVPLAIWIYLLLGRGGFWRTARPLSTPLDSDGDRKFTSERTSSDAHGRASSDRHDRKIVVIIPARNEAAVIGEAVSSLLRQDFSGPIHVIVIDDGSTDGTTRAATDALAACAPASGPPRSLTVLAGASLAPGWTGKLWAMSQGITAAEALEADYFLFTDADIRHEPRNVASLVAIAEAGDRDFVSYMVRLATASFAERRLIPAFVFFFFMLYPPAWVARTGSRTAAAAGGCMLVRPPALRRAGGLAAVRAQLIDDCALARAVKAAGGTLWLGLTRSACSLRSYHSYREIGAMISRSAFSQLRHSYVLLAVTLAALAVTYLAPPLLLLARDPVLIALGAAAWLLMTLAYLPLVRFYAVAAPWSLSLPLVAMFYGAATLHSAVQYSLGRGGRWKGRIQDVRAGG